jgi:hypothetical protein
MASLFGFGGGIAGTVRGLIEQHQQREQEQQQNSLQFVGEVSDVVLSSNIEEKYSMFPEADRKKIQNGNINEIDTELFILFQWLLADENIFTAGVPCFRTNEDLNFTLNWFEQKNLIPKIYYTYHKDTNSFIKNKNKHIDINKLSEVIESLEIKRQKNKMA